MTHAVNDAYVSDFVSQFAESCGHVCDLSAPAAAREVATLELDEPLLVVFGAGSTEVKYLVRPHESGLEAVVVVGNTLQAGWYHIGRDGHVSFASRDGETPSVADIKARVAPVLAALARRSAWERVLS